MKLKFDSESGVFTIKPESLAETVKLRTSALDIANLLVDYFDADRHQSRHKQAKQSAGSLK